MTLYEDEIDIRPYLAEILKNWLRILLIALLAGATAFLWSMQKPRSYQTSATILITRSRPQLNLSAQYPTVTEPIDQKARMDALLSIANSDSLALQVQEALANSGSGYPTGLADFKGLVETTSQGDIITVTAKTRDPESAALLANTWASEAVKAMNLAYSGEQPLAEIQQQVTTSAEEYAASQSELEEFLQNDQTTTLEAELNIAQSALTTLSEQSVNQLDFFVERKINMESLIVQAKALKGQLETASSSGAGQIGDALSVLTARAQSFGIQPMPRTWSNLSGPQEGEDQRSGSGANTSPSSAAYAPYQLSLNIGDVNTIDGNPDYTRDLDHIIQVAELEAASAEEQIQKLTITLADPDGNVHVTSLAQRIQSLMAALEAEVSMKRELTSQRDLAWQTYQALLAKESEIQNNSKTTNYTAMANQAVPPESPASRGTVLNTVVAAALGGVLAVFWVLLSFWWKSFVSGSSRPVAPIPEKGTD